MKNKIIIQVFSPDLTRKMDFIAKELLLNQFKDGQTLITYLDETDNQCDLITSNTVVVLHNARTS